MNFLELNGFYQRLLFLLPFTSHSSFNYDEPNQWYIDSPQCLGNSQSPIAISTHKALPIYLPPLLFGYYDVLLIDFLKLKNNGHTIHFDIPNTLAGVRPFITGGLLEDIYEAQEVHFHWGSPEHKGSEHKVNGRRYDLEMHIVHKNTKYVNLEWAREFDDGIAVVAILFKVVKSPNVYYPGLNALYNSLEYIVEYNSTFETTELISLDALLGDIDREDFFTYKGSLTTPPCSEAVTWHLFPQVIPISYIELPKFWNLLDSKGHELRNNFRPLQSTKYRTVYHRYRHPAENDIL